MTNLEFRFFLNLLMCADPWPVPNDPEGEDSLKDMADRFARERGYANWIEAYHFYVPEDK